MHSTIAVRKHQKHDAVTRKKMFKKTIRYSKTSKAALKHHLRMLQAQLRF